MDIINMARVRARGSDEWRWNDAREAQSGWVGGRCTQSIAQALHVRVQKPQNTITRRARGDAQRTEQIGIQLCPTFQLSAFACVAPTMRPWRGFEGGRILFRTAIVRTHSGDVMRVRGCGVILMLKWCGEWVDKHWQNVCGCVCVRTRDGEACATHVVEICAEMASTPSLLRLSRAAPTNNI